MNKFLGKLLVIVSPLLLGSFAVFFTSADSVWYSSLVKPAFSPPDWMFGPIWIIFYILMGIALFIVVESESSYRKVAIKVFVAQLALNIIWTLMFFGLESPLLGLINIIALWIFIIVTIFYFFAISKTAGWLLVPYIVWVTFAMFLNFSVYGLN